MDKSRAAITEHALGDAMRDVLRKEAAALVALVSMVDASWLRAVAMLDETRRNGGRVIVSGVGKSGHVGRKIAATLASTGTPAFFVHGTEASHGDLGNLRRGDAVLLLSASGATRELLDIAHFAADNAIALVLISRKPESLLGRLVGHVIQLPDLPEACPNGQAPTVSSTAMLAAGDALAIGLMRLARFGPEDFRRIHPGGSLGRRAGAE